MIYIYFFSESITKTDIVKPKNEDGYRETILQKGIDFSRRNSYSDLSKRNSHTIIYVLSIGII